MQKIVAIGGGGLALRETLAIVREIVRLTDLLAKLMQGERAHA